MRTAQQAWLNSSARLSTNDVVIPVHFHVIRYDGGSGDVPDAMLFDQLDVLSAAYNATRFRFALNGITRTNSTAWTTHQHGSAAAVAMRDALGVSPGSVLNVYVCQDPRSSSGTSILGYATFPVDFAQSSKQHSVIVHAGSLPNGTQTNFNLGYTGVHEVGHYLGLFHTFQNGCVSPGDDVNDTPYHQANSGCPGFIDTCPSQSGSDPVSNYMNYTDDPCMTMFTSGQADRMYAQTSTYRSTLWSSGLNQVSRLSNVSTRLKVGTGNDLAIAGFVVTGSQSRTVLARGIGPSLIPFNLGVPILANPTLTMYQGSSAIGSNDDWRNPSSNETEVLGTPYPPSHNLESARKFTLSPGAHSIHVGPSGASATGVGMVELFDLDGSPQNSRIVNLSTRGLTGAGANVMIGGFVIVGGYMEVLITGKGPSLPLSNKISDPTLTLFKGQTVVGSNDDWSQAWNDAQVLAALSVFAGQGAPQTKESAMLKVLAPGAYTVFVSNVAGTEGTALFEVFSTNQY